MSLEVDNLQMTKSTLVIFYEITERNNSNILRILFVYVCTKILFTIPIYYGLMAITFRQCEDQYIVNYIMAFI